MENSDAATKKWGHAVCDRGPLRNFQLLRRAAQRNDSEMNGAGFSRYRLRKGRSSLEIKKLVTFYRPAFDHSSVGDYSFKNKSDASMQ